MKRVLIIEDDLDAANVLEAYLKREQFETSLANNGQRGLEQVFRWKPDIILLDVMLPGMSGTDVLLAVRRRSDVPVIMITAISDGPDKISALRFGADDYVVKPYNPGEVVARVHAVLRRYGVGGQRSDVIAFRELKADMESMTISVKKDDGTQIPLELTPTELSFLVTFLKSPHKAFTRQALLEACLPESDALERVVDTHIYNLRKKLEAAGQKDILINIRGIGYRFANT
ncbi:response regulator [Morganella morganii]|uniref:response regulator n=1 Tax=Morganella morganii TaxID=582 RepID=UPI00128B249C|nr:response regulator [Morganella morganii]MQC09042.1 DNA-binding response regulator [Morganella morganii]MQC11718.1 DNA-binding response regulator [Morganella morganii]MQC16379.1 DNA-binding response regulator [Morganella morganii]